MRRGQARNAEARSTPRARHAAVRAAAAAIALSFAALAAASCELLVDGEIESIRCDEEGFVGPPACPEGSACVKGSCVRAQGIGAPCSTDADCRAPDLCVSPEAWGGEGASLCTRPCCSSSDCDEPGGPSNAVCWIPPQGGRGFCRPAPAVDRSVPGPRSAGEPCMSGASCRSGLCEAGTCRDACCSDSGCAVAGASCRLGVTALAPQGPSWSCAATPSGNAPALAPCNEDGDCASGLCVAVLGQPICAMPCCSSGSCGAITVEGTAYLLACGEVERGATRVWACTKPLPETARGVVGVECALDEACRGGRCIEAPNAPGKHVCSDACCNDASCGDPLFACRPLPVGPQGAWDLRCVVR